MKTPFHWPGFEDWVKGALEEDLGSGDITTESVVPPERTARMEWVAKTPLVVCGIFAAIEVFRQAGAPAGEVEFAPEGHKAAPGEVILKLDGPARALLTGERTALNVVQHLSGIATTTDQYVRKAGSAKVKIAATRKTIPYMRRLEKYAVTVGGASPHRYGLDDGVLIKDNHIAVAGSIEEAVRRARSGSHHLVKIEVEVTDMGQAREALAAGADLLLLDNMSDKQMEDIASEMGDRIILEASGNMTLERIQEAAKTGVHLISVGALTHSVRAADISARMTPL